MTSKEKSIAIEKALTVIRTAKIKGEAVDFKYIETTCKKYEAPLKAVIKIGQL